MGIPRRTGFHEGLEGIDGGLVAEAGTVLVKRAEHVAEDEGRVELRSGLVVAVELEGALVENRQVSSDANRLTAVVASAVAERSTVDGNAELVVVAAVAANGEEVEVTVNVERKLGLLKSRDASVQAGDVLLHLVNVGAELRELAAELVDQSSQSGDVVGVNLDLVLKSVDSSLEVVEVFLGRNTVDSLHDVIDLALKTVGDALEVGPSGVDGNRHFVSGSRAATAEKTVGVANEQTLRLQASEFFVSPVVLGNVREVVLSDGRHNHGSAKNECKCVFSSSLHALLLRIKGSIT